MTWPAHIVSNESAQSHVWDVQWLTIDPAAIVRSEEGNHASNVLRNSTALEWAVVSHEFLDLIRWPFWCASWNILRLYVIISNCL